MVATHVGFPESWILPKETQQLSFNASSGAIEEEVWSLLRDLAALSVLPLSSICHHVLGTFIESLLCFGFHMPFLTTIVVDACLLHSVLVVGSSQVLPKQGLDGQPITLFRVGAPQAENPDRGSCHRLVFSPEVLKLFGFRTSLHCSEVLKAPKMFCLDGLFRLIVIVLNVKTDKLKYTYMCIFTDLLK